MDRTRRFKDRSRRQILFDPIDIDELEEWEEEYGYSNSNSRDWDEEEETVRFN